MSNAANELIREFIKAFSADDGHVALRQRGGHPGYIHIVPSGFDPMRPEDRHVAVELYNGTVCVTKELQQTVSAQERPNLSIHEHPLGGSSGTEFGRFKWALSHDTILARWDSLGAFVVDIARQYRTLTPFANRE